MRGRNRSRRRKRLEDGSSDQALASRSEGADSPVRNRRVWSNRLRTFLAFLIASGIPTIIAVDGSCRSRRVEKSNIALQQEQIDLAQRTASLEHRPVMSVLHVGHPSIELPIDSTRVTGRTAIFFGTLLVGDSISIKNVGVGPARVLGTFAYDSPLYTPVLRERLRNGAPMKFVIPAKKLDAPAFPTLAPGESAVVFINYPVRHTDPDSSNGELVVHLLVAYEDELGSLFDSYSWGVYRLPPTRAAVHGDTLIFGESRVVRQGGAGRPSLSGETKLLRGTWETHLYGKTEGDSIRTRIQAAFERWEKGSTGAS